MHVVRPTAGVDVADFLAGDQSRRLPPDITGGEPIGARGCQVRLDLDVRKVGLERGVRVDHSADVTDPLLDVLGLDAQGREIWSVDPDHDRLAGAGEHLLDPLAEVGLHVAVQAGVDLHCVVNLIQGLVVVDVRAHADPVLTEVHAVDLVGEQGLTDMGPAVADTGDLAEVLAGRDRHPGLLCH